MKRIVPLLFFILIGIIASGQDYSWYSPLLSESQKEYRDYALGVVVSKEGKTVLKTEPMFDRVYFKGNYVIAQILVGGKDYSGRTGYFSTEIWLCLDNNLRLKFIFPIDTQDVSYSAKNNIFLYTTQCSAAHDFWYNTGVIDENGDVIFRANDKGEVAIDGDILVGSSEGNDDSEKGIKTMDFTIRAISANKEIAKMQILIPVSTWELIDSSHDCWNYKSEDPMYNACELVYHVSKINEAILAFQRLKKSKHNEIAYCSKNNIKELRKVKKQIMYGHRKASIATR